MSDEAPTKGYTEDLKLSQAVLEEIKRVLQKTASGLAQRDLRR